MCYCIGKEMMFWSHEMCHCSVSYISISEAGWRAQYDSTKDHCIHGSSCKNAPDCTSQLLHDNCLRHSDSYVCTIVPTQTSLWDLSIQLDPGLPIFTFSLVESSHCYLYLRLLSPGMHPNWSFPGMQGLWGLSECRWMGGRGSLGCAILSHWLVRWSWCWVH